MIRGEMHIEIGQLAVNFGYLILTPTQFLPSPLIAFGRSPSFG